jgi:sulfur carrier protein
MHIHLNDTSFDLPADATLADLAHDLGLAARRGVAVSVNDTVVPRAAWPGHALADGDRVLVIQATQGG